jgi:hypothetical protein
MDRRKRIIQKPRTVLEAIRSLLKKDEVKAANKILLGIYRKGWAANVKGQDRFTNPYLRETPYREEWNRGWIECSKLIKRRSSDSFEVQLPRSGNLST